MAKNSIKITYFHSISTEFHKRYDLFWEQRVGGSNPLATTIENADQTELFAPSEKLAGVAFEGGGKFRPRHAVDTRYLPPATPGRFTGAGLPARDFRGYCSDFLSLRSSRSPQSILIPAIPLILLVQKAPNPAVSCTRPPGSKGGVIYPQMHRLGMSQGRQSSFARCPLIPPQRASSPGTPVSR